MKHHKRTLRTGSETIRILVDLSVARGGLPPPIFMTNTNTQCTDCPSMPLICPMASV